MRALIFLPLAILFSDSALGSTVRLSREQGSQTSINEQNIPYVTQILSVDDVALAQYGKLNLSLTSLDQSDAERNLTLENGQEVPLKQFDTGLRQIIEAGAAFQLKNHLITVSTSQDVKTSAFKEKKFSISDRIDFYSGATAFTFLLSSSEQDQPLSYFTHPETLQGTQRSSHISTTILNLSLEQIWTEIFRTEFTTYLKNSKGYRPNENGVAAKLAIALTDRWSYLNEMGTAQENTREKLSEDRGYFKSSWLDQEINYEWSLDSFVAFGWSTLDENETDPRRNINTKLGSDQIGISVKQQFATWAYDLKSQYTLTSNKESSLSFKGGLAWNF